MVGFNDLSNELILMIWEYAELEDVYNFSTASKKVYLLVRENLREHCRLMRRLSTITNVEAEPGKPSVLGQALKEILHNPHAARYPSLLRFQGCLGQPQEGANNFEIFKKTIIKNAINISKQDIEQDLEAWEVQVREGKEEPLLLLLLLLLPNLREIHLSSEFDTISCIRPTLGVILLEKLQSVSLKCTGNTHPEFLDFSLVSDFACQPSVTSIHSHNVATTHDDLLYYVDSDFDTTNVVSLTFVECRINPRSMSQFLSTTQNLEHFYYSPREFAHMPGDFDPFYLRDALLANAYSTLKSLTILAGRQTMPFMGSLARFQCLESVETNFRLLIGCPSESHHTLSTTLPPSIVNVTLHMTHLTDGAYCKLMIEEMIDDDDEAYFERLARITIRGVSDTRAAEREHESLIGVLEGKGIGLSFAME